VLVDKLPPEHHPGSWWLRLLDRLLAHPEVQVDAPGRHGDSPLVLCVRKEQREAARRLASAGADPYKVHEQGDHNALWWAARANPRWDHNLERLCLEGQLRRHVGTPSISAPRPPRL